MILYFRSWNDAVSRAANKGWKQRPQQRPVWFAHESAPVLVWSLEVPSEIAALSDVWDRHLPDVQQADS